MQTADLTPLWCANDRPHDEHWHANEFGGHDYCSGRPDRLRFDPQEKLVRRWYCNVCHEKGPWYDAGDISVHAGWAVHVGEHERESAGKSDG